MTFFLFIVLKKEQEALYFGENGIIKSAFHKNKKPVNINKVDIEIIIIKWIYEISMIRQKIVW